MLTNFLQMVNFHSAIVLPLKFGTVHIHVLSFTLAINMALRCCCFSVLPPPPSSLPSPASHNSPPSSPPPLQRLITLLPPPPPHLQRLIRPLTLLSPPSPPGSPTTPTLSPSFSATTWTRPRSVSAARPASAPSSTTWPYLTCTRWQPPLLPSTSRVPPKCPSRPSSAPHAVSGCGGCDILTRGTLCVCVCVCCVCVCVFCAAGCRHPRGPVLIRPRYMGQHVVGTVL